MFIFDRFEELRKEKGVTKAHITSKLGRTQTLCQDWKAGKSQPSGEQLRIVAEILGTTTAYLTGESDEKERPAAQQGSGISERDLNLLAWFRSLPPEKQKAILISQDAPRELF